MRFPRLSSLFLLLLAPGLAARAAEPVLKIVGPAKTVTFTAAEFAALPHIQLDLPARGDQEERKFGGVAMRELLARAGAPFDKMRGAALTTAVLVHCKDNYAVLFALAEFDPNFSSRTILLADQDEGQPLPPSAAPYRIVTPGDLRAARSCKQVTWIEIVPLAKP